MLNDMSINLKDYKEKMKGVAPEVRDVLVSTYLDIDHEGDVEMANEVDCELADIDERDPHHLRHNTKKAVEELYTKGILSYCLTLDTNADAYVNRIFGSNNYTIIDNVGKLLRKVTDTVCQPNVIKRRLCEY